MFLFESIQMFIRIEGAHDKLMRGAAVGVDQGYVCHHFGKSLAINLKAACSCDLLLLKQHFLKSHLSRISIET